jgi:hypothetical protein
MPPCLDIYVFSHGRDRETLNRFIGSYVDRAASEDRGDEELMILRSGAEPEEVNAWEWEPAKTLSHILDRGLERPRRAFIVYLRTTDERCDGATLGFTADDRVVFGLSMDDPHGEGRILETAKLILVELADIVAADRGLITWEEPPPITPTDAEQVRRALFSWTR